MRKKTPSNTCAHGKVYFAHWDELHGLSNGVKSHTPKSQWLNSNYKTFMKIALIGPVDRKPRQHPCNRLSPCITTGSWKQRKALVVED